MSDTPANIFPDEIDPTQILDGAALGMYGGAIVLSIANAVKEYLMDNGKTSEESEEIIKQIIERATVILGTYMSTEVLMTLSEDKTDDE